MAGCCYTIHINKCNVKQYPFVPNVPKWEHQTSRSFPGGKDQNFELDVLNISYTTIFKRNCYLEFLKKYFFLRNSIEVRALKNLKIFLKSVFEKTLQSQKWLHKTKQDLKSHSYHPNIPCRKHNLVILIQPRLQ